MRTCFLAWLALALACGQDGIDDVTTGSTGGTTGTTTAAPTGAATGSSAADSTTEADTSSGTRPTDAASEATGEDSDGGLPTPAELLPAATYDCAATGPFVARARPYQGLCHSDSTCQSPLVVAHRFGALFAPENSLSALRAAILLGVDVAESDLRLTADGHVVLLHDPTVDRTTDGSGAVATMTLAEVQALHLEPMPAHTPGDFSCDRVPSLAEAVALAAGQIALELEVKTSAAGVAAAEYLRDLGLPEGVYLRCDPSECAAIRTAVADARIMTIPAAGEAAGSTAAEPPPVVVRVDPALFDAAALASIAAIGAKSSLSTLGDLDAVAAQGQLSTYSDLYTQGLGMLLTEWPHLVLLELGRLEP